MSPRAASRLETLGFTEVYDYTPGEADWFAWGLPMEGAKASLPRVGTAARRDVPRCHLRDRVADIRARVADWDVCVVVNERDVVLGLLRPREFETAAEATAEDAMRSGPATWRPDGLLSDALEHLLARRVPGVLVTRSDGTLVGWLRRADAERLLQSQQTQPPDGHEWE